MIISGGRSTPPSARQRRRHAERQANLETAPNPVHVLPPDRGPRVRTVRRLRYTDTTARSDQHDPANDAIRGRREDWRYNLLDGQLICARFDSRCSVCCQWTPEGEAIWWNAALHQVTCTNCQPTGQRFTPSR